MNGVGKRVGGGVGADVGGVGAGVGALVGERVGEHLPPKRLQLSSKQQPPATAHLIASALGSEQGPITFAFVGAGVVVVVADVFLAFCLCFFSLFAVSFMSATTL